jgi:membrane fusion protein (multidrug efflux system)
MRASHVQTLVLLLIPLHLTGSHARGQKPRDKPRQVEVITVQSKSVTLMQQYACQIHSRRHIDVRVPAEGHLAAIPIREGQSVKTGEVMFEIGSILYKAKLDAKLAERDIAQLELNNTRRLAERQGVSQFEVKLSEAKLARAQAMADLALAELNFTKVKAPFDGMVGRLPRQEGSFVQKGETLTTLSDNGVMWVYFDVPERRYYEYLAEQGRNRRSPEVELLLAGHSKFPQAGKIAAIDANFNDQTGAIAFRADFPNPDGLLRHGQSGTLRIGQVQDDAIVIPQRATFEDLDKRYVYVVDKDKIAHRREVVVQNESEDLFVIKQGVGVGDKIVLDGVRLVRDGEKVE